MNKFIPLLGTILFLFAIACIEPFNPELGEAQDVLVIEGQVLEGAEVSRIRLSRTAEIGSTEERMVSDAEVIIRDDQGGEYLLVEDEPGIYQSDSTQLVGTSGVSYQLAVRTAAGESYESSWEIMRGTSGIEQVYFEIEEKEDSIAGEFTTGAQLYLDTRDTENKSRYYRWEWEETWEFTVPFPAYYSWDFTINRPVEIPEEDWGYLCWGNRVSSGILLATTSQLEEDVIDHQPLRFVSLGTNQIFRKYSIQVKQYVLTPEAYSYWNTLEALNENLGTLFDPIPSQIIGNIRNLDNPNAPIIGYFGAYGFAKERYWIEREDLPQGVRVSSGYAECAVDSITNSADFVAAVLYGSSVYLDSIVGDFGQFAGWITVPDYCADCKLAGTNVKPDFWQ